MSHDHRHLRRAVGLVLTLLAAHTGTLGAQGRSAGDARVVDGYRLTMPVLRKVLPAINAAPTSCKRSQPTDPHTLSIAEMTRTLERCEQVSRALRRAGVSPRDAAIVFGSMLRTAQAVALRGGKAGAVPAGPLRDNALLLERNAAELKQLTQTGGRS